MLTFASGGWVLLLAVLLSLAAVAWVLAHGRHTIGDGRNPATYGFDLSHTLVPRDQIVAAVAKDALEPLTDPHTVSVAEAQAAGANQYRRYLLNNTRVIGVTINGDARCYPLPVMQLHEVCNDTVGGVPVLVTYNGLCDSVVVARREAGGQVRTFGTSGLLYNSNLLLYDRQARNAEESLWSQLEWRAIAGPAAEARLTLTLLPCELVTWPHWRAEHPEGRVIVGVPELAGDYPMKRWQSYLSNPEIKFPVSPLWHDPAHAAKTPVAAVRSGGTWRVYLLDELAALPADERARALAASPVPLGFDASSATLCTAHPDTDTVYALLFAWYAMHPDQTHGHLVP